MAQGKLQGMTSGTKVTVWGFDGKERNLKNSKRHQVAQIRAVAK